METHNRMLDRMVSTLLLCNLPRIVTFVVLLKISLSFSCLADQGNDMDSSRGVLSGTMDKFKMVCKIRRPLFQLCLSLDVCAESKLFPRLSGI